MSEKRGSIEIMIEDRIEEIAVEVVNVEDHHQETDRRQEIIQLEIQIHIHVNQTRKDNLLEKNDYNF